jgi:hypothetical protein
MTVSVEIFRMNREDHEEDRFTVYGPMWQAECNWCCEMSDPLDRPESARDWVAGHRCSVSVTLAAEEGGDDADAG